MLALMLVPDPWVHGSGWKMKKVNYNARECCIACYTMHGTIAYANHTNETIIYQIEAQALQYLTMFLGYAT